MIEELAFSFDALERRVARLEWALRQLEQWDVLYLDEGGHGAFTADAPWARALIREALDQ